MEEDAWNFTDRAEAILPKDVSSGLDAAIMDEKSERNLQAAYLKQKEEEKKIYLEMARRRDEIMALLRRQRAERIKKEMISQPYKPNQDDVNKRAPPLKHPEDTKQDVEAVRGLN